MFYHRGHLARPLDAALSSGSRLAALRTLAGAGSAGRSGREVARLAGINHQSAAGALADLHKLGLVTRSRSGRKSLWNLDRARWLVSEVLAPMLERESKYATEISDLVKSTLKSHCRAAMVVGDGAKGRLAAGRPLSLVAVERGSRRDLTSALRSLKAELAQRWGVELDARAVSAAEAARIAALEEAWRLLPDEGPGFSISSKER